MIITVSSRSIMTSSDQIEATSSGRAVRTNVSFRMSSAPLAFWSRYIHRWSSGSLSWWIVQICLIGYTPLMLKVSLVNYWYISIENILRECIKVFLRRPPRVRNDLDEALFSTEKVIINENTLIIWSLAIEDGLRIWSLVICKMNIFKKSTFLLSIASTDFLLLQHISLFIPFRFWFAQEAGLQPSPSDLPKLSLCS